jgi:hypothetical protein
MLMVIAIDQFVPTAHRGVPRVSGSPSVASRRGRVHSLRMCGPDPADSKPSARALVANWREYEGPFHEKLRLAVRNNWTKIRTRSDCCGNYGEPGC